MQLMRPYAAEHAVELELRTDAAPDFRDFACDGSVLADRAPISGIGVYSLTKAAVAGLSRNLARELGPRGITVNTIQPGPVHTDANPDTGEFADAVRSATAVGHYGQPRDIADAVAFLARAETQFVTGATWNVDGGYAL